MFGTPFELFGSVHLITILVIIAVTVLLPKFYKNKSEDQKSVMSKIIATVIALHVIISPYKDLYILANPYDWRETIPLHMCDLSEIFLIWFLLGGPRILYLCAFFWGLAGASMAISAYAAEAASGTNCLFTVNDDSVACGAAGPKCPCVPQRFS